MLSIELWYMETSHCCTLSF